jgi:glycosyltransferase involved in cell wall biosynthesis
MTHPLVSVIIPTYNCAGFLREALASVLAQTYRPLEILVIDDGSTDDPQAALGPHRRRVTFLTQDHRGAASARNLGIRHARGQLLALLDADDLWSAQKIAQQVRALEAHPEAALAFTDGVVMRDGEVLSRISDNHEAFREWVARRNGSAGVAAGWFDRQLGLSCCIATSSVMVRKAALARAGGFNEFLPFEEYDLFQRIAKHYPFVFVNAPLMTYRIRDGSVSTSTRWAHQPKRLEERFVKIREGEEAASRAVLRRLTGRLADAYWSRGWRYLHAGLRQEARWNFTRSLTHRPFHLKAYPYLVATCLPRHWVQGLRRTKRRFSQGSP